jgi:putative membrane protein insertion efficiency factor
MRRISTIPAVFLIKKYQKYAPKDLRASCRFEPTCSNYMLLALEKYGLIKGLYFGLKRFLRCKVPNGGFDYP